MPRKSKVEDAAYQRRYRIANREKIAARDHASYVANADERRAWQRNYSKTQWATNAEYRQKHTVHIKVWEGRYPERVRLKSYRSNARKRSLEWSIPEGLALDLFTDNCFYCGAVPQPLNGIDRVDSAVGYTENNVVSACWRCNQGKNDMPRSEFEAWISRAAIHQAQFTVSA